MPTDPDNDRFIFPFNEGDDDWDENMESAMDRLEREVPEDKTLANRPSPDANQAPNWLFATDDANGRGVLYRNQGTSWDGFGVSAEAIQAGRDGYVVAIAPGLGIAGAFDKDGSTPIQDAVDAIEAVGQAAVGPYGAGTIIIPPGRTQTPGGIANLGGKVVRGYGWESSIIECTDLTATCFALGGDNVNKRQCEIRDLTIDGSSQVDRTSGSAISNDDTSGNSGTGSIVSIGIRFDKLQFLNWGGPDPVIEGRFGFSLRMWDLRAQDYNGSFISAEPGFLHMGHISINHSDFDTPALDFFGVGGHTRIESANIGGNVGYALNVDSKYSRYSSFRMGYINMEPDAAHGGTLTSQPAPIMLRGAAPTHIGHISQDDQLSSDYTVAIDGSANYSSTSNDGPANNQIGSVLYDSAPSVNIVGVMAAPKEPSWYWGTGTEVDYGGFATSAVIPMADLTTA